MHKTIIYLHPRHSGASIKTQILETTTHYFNGYNTSLPSNDIQAIYETLTKQTHLKYARDGAVLPDNHKLIITSHKPMNASGDRRGPPPRKFIENNMAGLDQLLVYSIDYCPDGFINDAYNNDVDLTLIRNELTLTPHPDITNPAIADIMSELKDRGPVYRDYKGGSPPKGTKVKTIQNGKQKLIATEEYPEIRETLQQVVDGEKTQTAAADELGWTRHTVRTAINERRGLYNLH